MPALVVCVSAKGRTKLYKSVLGLSVCSGCVSGLFLGALTYSYVRHSFLLHELIISLFDDVYVNLGLLGVKMALVASVCWKINRNIYHQATNHSVGRCQLVWSGSVSLCCVTAAICASSLTVLQHAVESQLLPRYKHGVASYLESPQWQTAVDRIQRYLECCGAHGPSDWYTTAWIPLESVSKTADASQYSKLVQPDGRVLVPLVPPSCCRPSAADCGHLSWLQNPRPDVAEADPRHLFTQGCAPAIASVITMDFHYFKILLVIIVLLQVGMLISLRYFYTASLSSVVLGRPQGIAPGWLVGRIVKVAEPEFGFLARYDQTCHREDILLEDEPSKRKKKLKCFDKCKRKKKDQPDSDETQSVKTKNRFACMKKLKEKCKKKKKEKSGLTESREVLQRVEENAEREEQQQFRVEIDNRLTAFNKSRTQVKRKLSSNLLDVEEVVVPPPPAAPTLQVYTEDTRTNNPFVAATRETNNTPRRSTSPIPSPRRSPKYQWSQPTGNQEPTDNVEQRRKIFENLDTTVGLNTRLLNIRNYRERRKPSVLVEELKERLEKPSSPASTRGDEEAPPIVLRNYRLPT